VDGCKTMLDGAAARWERNGTGGGGGRRAAQRRRALAIAAEM